MLRCLIVLALILSGGLAFAADDKPSSETQQSETERQFSIPVPMSEIKLEPLRFVPPNPTEMAFGASTWTPRNFARGSYTGAVSRFDRGDVPSVSITRIQQVLIEPNGFTLSTKLGIGYASLQRSTERTIFNSDAGRSTEDINLFSARVGLEATWAHLLPWGFEPDLSMAALPTWMTGSKSQFEDSVGAFGLPYELTLGILWRAPRGASHFGNISVGVAGQEIIGNVGGSSMTGFGIVADLRVTL
jgi:hypothetical protein